jgi:hypothetical protein
MRRWVTLIELVPSTVLVALDQLPVECELSAAETPPSLHGICSALGGTTSPVWIAQDLGLFTKYGLQHSLKYLAATTAIQAIVGSTVTLNLCEDKP